MSDSPLINRTYHFHLILICFRGRPFIIANHSQGTWHSLKLIGNSIDRTYLVKRLVVAYIIGGQVNVEEIERMADIKACKTPTDLHCVVHWKNYFHPLFCFTIDV